MIRLLLKFLLWFVNPLTRSFVEVDSEELSEISEASTPKNTKRSTETVRRLYKEWAAWKAQLYPDLQPPPELNSKDYRRLPGALSQFFCEMRKFDAGQYRGDTIKVYFAGANRILKAADPAINLYKSPVFHETVRTVDGLIRTLRKTENPIKKQATPIKKSEETEMRANGLMGHDSPLALFRALLYECGKQFGLRGGQELRDVRKNQFHFVNIKPGLVQITYYETTSKTNHAGLAG